MMLTTGNTKYTFIGKWFAPRVIPLWN